MKKSPLGQVIDQFCSALEIDSDTHFYPVGDDIDIHVSGWTGKILKMKCADPDIGIIFFSTKQKSAIIFYPDGRVETLIFDFHQLFRQYSVAK
jgi:hypothetical protein